MAPLHGFKTKLSPFYFYHNFAVTRLKQPHRSNILVENDQNIPFPKAALQQHFGSNQRNNHSQKPHRSNILVENDQNIPFPKAASRQHLGSNQRNNHVQSRISLVTIPSNGD
jgi:hypothetical protein